ncbi:uncharacterized protein LOC125195124 [Salvia hispanica]|uniref:uncharacterized protein LOC125195124 n=1 Tax=Salvia hispanica TaxID=49212 RepID=UPI002009754F|nr:uncharacterized protein LOC125195124 [Salvia hispanica]
MSRDIFVRIVHTLEGRDEYFQYREDGIGRPGLTPLQKCTVAIRQLAYDTTTDMFDEYLHVGDTTGREYLKNFCKIIVEAFGDTYLQRPTADDCQSPMRMHETVHGFPGMLGSIVCMHWQWKNCPAAWRCQFTSGYKGNHPTMILEAVADHRLWIWFKEVIVDVMYACIIMHNMIVEQEVGSVTDWVDDEAGPSSSTATPPVAQGLPMGFGDVLQRQTSMRSQQDHTQLMTDMIEEVWNRNRR